MKVTNLEGNWIGLGYWRDFPYQIDYFSSPDGWNIGFEIAYRLSFSTDDRRSEETRLADGFREAFKKAFGLSDSHYELNQWVDFSVYWRIYWDREGFDLRLLEKCESNLNKFAEDNRTRIVLIGMIIIPRSLEYISKHVGGQ